MKKHYFFLLISSVLLLSTAGCNSDDDGKFTSDQFVTANVNGVAFQSDQNVGPLGFSRTLTPSGSINLYAKAVSSDGYVMEMQVENYKGPGKYYIGENFYNKSWMKFHHSAETESWSISSNGALNKHSNYIEITSVKDNYIEGKIGCKELRNSLDGVLGAMEGEFRLLFIE